MRFEEAVGKRVKALREESGHRQDDLARASREVGLDWTRPVVAALESGRREVLAQELLLLPLALGRLHIQAELSDLLRDLGEVELTDSARGRAEGHFLEKVLAGDSDEVSGDDLDAPLWRELRRFGKHASAKLSLYKRLWPRGTFRQLESALADAHSEAEVKVARAEGVDPEVIAILSHRLWGRGFSAERDARMTNLTGSDRAMRARRGHVSRQLRKELQPLIDKSKGG